MNQTPIDSGVIRAYLLGGAQPEEADKVEDAYFADEEALAEVGGAEHDLIEDYLADRLGPADRACFDAHYLASPAHRRRVAIARELRSRSRPKRRAIPILPLALAAALVMAAALGLLSLRRPLPSDERASGTPASASTGPVGAAEGRVVITLPALLLRGEGETPTVHVHADTRSVALRLEREDTAAAPPPQEAAYAATVTTVEGREVWSGPAAAPSPVDAGSAPLIAVVTLPSPSLASGDYVVKLSPAAGGAELGRYYFRLVRD